MTRAPPPHATKRLRPISATHIEHTAAVQVADEVEDHFFESLSDRTNS